jgi:hypothetical protein
VPPAIQHAIWGLCAAVVLLYILVAALGAVDPTDAELATAAVMVAAVLWLAHSWRRLWDEERGRR